MDDTLTNDLIDPRRAELTHRMKELLDVPHVGKLARKLRKRAGLSPEELGYRIDVAPEDIKEAEKTGLLRSLGLDAIMRTMGSDEDPEEEAAEVLESYIAELMPSAEEEAALRFDLLRAMATLVTEMREWCGATDDAPATRREVEDPWEKSNDGTSRKSRQRPRYPTVSATTRLGGAEASSARAATRASDAPHPAEVSSPHTVTVSLRMVTRVDGRDVASTQIASLEKEYGNIADIGLTMDEAKDVLSRVQVRLVQEQVAGYVKLHSRCKHCHRQLGIKDRRTIRFRTLFGNLALGGDRYRRCSCVPAATKTVTPVAELLPERTAPELLFLESKMAALASYGITAKLLKEFLPIDVKLSPSTVWAHAMKVGQRCEDSALTNAEDALFEEGQYVAIDPSLESLTVGIDGGYLKNWHQRTGKFEVIVGKSVAANDTALCFGGVHRYDGNPRGRLGKVLLSQGYESGTPVRFLSDGEKVVRNLQKTMVPNATHVLDLFHVAMRFTVLKQFVRGLVRIEKDEGTYTASSAAFQAQQLLDSAKWRLWNGRLNGALERLDDLSFEVVEFEERYGRFQKLEATIDELYGYLDRNRDFIVDYGAEHRAGRPISTSFVESLVNSLIAKRFSKKQHMQWTPRGAHLLLQLRVQLSNDELWETFRCWYPALPPAGQGANNAPSAASKDSVALRLVA